MNQRDFGRWKQMLHSKRHPIALALCFASTVVGLASTVTSCGDTYCQSGPKYGTQCGSNSDLRSSPGQRPPLASEPPSWFTQPPPPARFGSTPAPGPTSGPVPMSSLNWRPTNVVLDAGPLADPQSTSSDAAAR